MMYLLVISYQKFIDYGHVDMTHVKHLMSLISGDASTDLDFSIWQTYGLRKSLFVQCVRKPILQSSLVVQIENVFIVIIIMDIVFKIYSTLCVIYSTLYLIYSTFRQYLQGIWVLFLLFPILWFLYYICMPLVLLHVSHTTISTLTVSITCFHFVFPFIQLFLSLSLRNILSIASSIALCVSLSLDVVCFVSIYISTPYIST